MTTSKSTNGDTMPKDTLKKKDKNSTTPKTSRTKFFALSGGLAAVKGWRAKLTPEMLERVAEDLVRYFRDEEKAFTFNDFYADYGILARTFQLAVKRSKALAEARDYAKQLIAQKQQRFALQNAPNCIMQILPLYHPDFKESLDTAHQRKLDIKSKEASSEVTALKVIEIPAIITQEDS